MLSPLNECSLDMRNYLLHEAMALASGPEELERALGHRATQKPLPATRAAGPLTRSSTAQRR